MKTRSPSLPKRIFIVEDHPVFREGLRQMVDRETDLRVCGEADEAEGAFEAITELKPDLVLLDITLPGKSGLDLLKDLRAAGRKIKVLVVSMHDEALYADRVLRAGGDGYIMKQEDPEEIVLAMRDVLEGRIYVSEEVLGAAARAVPERGVKAEARPIDELTDTELQILELLGRGKSNREIGRQVGANAPAIAEHLVHIRKKLNLDSVNALVRYAVCWVEGAGK